MPTCQKPIFYEITNIKAKKPSWDKNIEDFWEKKNKAILTLKYTKTAVVKSVSLLKKVEGPRPSSILEPTRSIYARRYLRGLYRPGVSRPKDAQNMHYSLQKSIHHLLLTLSVQ